MMPSNPQGLSDGSDAIGKSESVNFLPIVILLVDPARIALASGPSAAMFSAERVSSYFPAAFFAASFMRTSTGAKC